MLARPVVAALVVDEPELLLVAVVALAAMVDVLLPPLDGKEPRTSMKATVAPLASRPTKLPTIGRRAPPTPLDEAEAVLLALELLLVLLLAVLAAKGLLVPLRKEPDQPAWVSALL